MASHPDKPDFSNVKSGSSSSAAPAAPKPDFSNVKSGSASTAAPGSSTLQTYTVVKGDNLSKIAKKFYGNANQWRVIFEANRERISNPDLIQIGQVLKIPAAKS
ncbi:MAG TPA: LysM peptidoglycan-binding domain-containing protein [Dokdonella sp.]|jgi:nucleoid-associated protein YgaU|nr:LysM peptidoglycan-binding domain-containing protein [Dokdonella sp.]